ncbi:MAG: DUF262 domain-containing protein [Alphaproteobacteria bacterium]|jgi:hypothetical protein|nr:DUF262 domain-containing protein [Alphaproteobacteria bacterium]
MDDVLVRDEAEEESEDKNVIDEAAREPSEPVIFGISSYGADYTAELLVKRMRTGVYIVPPFQRAYVWPLRMASRFIESLMLGLPVPSIFLYKEEDTGKHLIIDGHQRLKTLQYFFDGTIGEKRFRLMDVQKRWVGKTYEDLDEIDRQNLDDALIHMIIFKQDAPSEDNTSIYHVFERLNTGGTKLYSQEIRNCVSHGAFVGLLEELNKIDEWRSIYGPINKRLKDQELILRFLGLYFEIESYKRPMNEFLNRFMKKHRKMSEETAASFTQVFTHTIGYAHRVLGSRAFRPERSLNAAVYDSVMVGLARRLDNPVDPDPEAIQAAYQRLLKNQQYKDAFTRSTADEESVATRLKLATEAFCEA